MSLAINSRWQTSPLCQPLLSCYSRQRVPCSQLVPTYLLGGSVSVSGQHGRRLRNMLSRLKQPCTETIYRSAVGQFLPHFRLILETLASCRSCSDRSQQV